MKVKYERNILYSFPTEIEVRRTPPPQVILVGTLNTQNWQTIRHHHNYNMNSGSHSASLKVVIYFSCNISTKHKRGRLHLCYRVRHYGIKESKWLKVKAQGGTPRTPPSPGSQSLAAPTHVLCAQRPVFWDEQGQLTWRLAVASKARKSEQPPEVRSRSSGKPSQERRQGLFFSCFQAQPTQGLFHFKN